MNEVSNTFPVKGPVAAYSIAGGGEMGELIRKFDWSKTSIGPIECWPQSLRSTLSILLHSNYPMFLWWGKDLIQFYNDAYRPSLGVSGKHPSALGQRGEECWPEVWTAVKPMIDQVLSGGGATWSEDQLFPIYRNGRLEDVYWTFSHSPVYDETGMPGGVLVVCNETTEKVKSVKSLLERKDQLEFAIEATQLGTWDYDPFTNKFKGNERLKSWFGLAAAEEIDLSVAFDCMVEKDRTRVAEAIQKAMEFSSGGRYDIEYTIIHPVTRQERIVHALGRAYFNKENTAYRFNGTLQDVTEQATTRRKAEESEKNLRNTILQAPVAWCFLKGPDFVVEIANERMCELWGKGKDVMDKPIFESLPEAKAEGFEELMRKVYHTGETYKALGVPVTLPRNGGLETVYSNFIYDAFRESNGTISGVMVVATEVTEQVIARKKIEESAQQVRSLIESAPFPIGVYVGREMRIQFVNQTILDIWGKGNDVVGKLYREVLPELENQNIYQQLDQVYMTGIPFHAKNQRVDLEVHGKLQPFFFNYSFTPLFDASGKVYGVMNTAAEVTDLILAKQQIEERNGKLEEEKMRTSLAVQAGELGVYELDLTTDELIVDERFKQIMGVEKEIKRMEYLQFYHPNDISVRDQAMKNMKNGVFEYEVRVFHPDQSIRWIKNKGKVYLDAAGKASKIIGVMQDITEQKNFAETLQKTNERLMRTNNDLDNFIYTASHDLKAPMSNIEGLLETLKDHLYSPQEESKEEREIVLQLMDQSVKRFKTTIQDLTEITKAQKTEEEDILEIKVSQIVEDVKLTIFDKIEQSGAIITTDFSNAPTLNFSKKNLRSIIYNLLSNAVKYRDTSRQSEIHISTEKIEGYKKLCISDNGLGLTPAAREKIFTMFKRFHDHVEGTGIGLYIVKRIIDNAGGKIEVQSELGKGTTFTIFFKNQQGQKQ